VDAKIGGFAALEALGRPSLDAQRMVEEAVPSADSDGRGDHTQLDGSEASVTVVFDSVAMWPGSGEQESLLTIPLGKRFEAGIPTVVCRGCPH
jgi:hypothetical protein